MDFRVPLIGTQLRAGATVIRQDTDSLDLMLVPRSPGRRITTTPGKGPISDAGELDVSWQFQRISGTPIHKKHIKAGNGQSGSNAATAGYLHSGVGIAIDNTESLQRVRGIAANTYGRMISSGPDEVLADLV